MTTEHDGRPPWLRDDGRQAAAAKHRYAIPPVPAALKGISDTKPLDEEKADRLFREFMTVVDEADGTEGLEELRLQVLDTMTANRISSLQAVRLIAAIIRRIEGGDHVARRIMPDGTDRPLGLGGEYGSNP